MIRRAERLKAAHQARVKIVPVSEQQVDHRHQPEISRALWKVALDCRGRHEFHWAEEILGARSADPSHLSLISR
jgi:hypothetical protein